MAQTYTRRDGSQGLEVCKGINARLFGPPKAGRGSFIVGKAQLEPQDCSLHTAPGGNPGRGAVRFKHMSRIQSRDR